MKNPHQNAGNGIKDTLSFKIFLRSMPPDPLEVLAPSAQVGQIRVRPPPLKISRTPMDPCVYYLFCYSVITYTHASIAILHYYNNQSHWLSYSMTLVVLLFVDPLKLNILTSRYKNSAKQVILSCQLIFPMHSTKCWIQFSFHKRFTVLMKQKLLLHYDKHLCENCNMRLFFGW